MVSRGQDVQRHMFGNFALLDQASVEDLNMQDGLGRQRLAIYMTPMFKPFPLTPRRLDGEATGWYGHMLHFSIARGQGRRLTVHPCWSVD